MLSLTCLTVGPLQENAYLLTDGGKAVLVDPGDEAERLLEAVEGFDLEAVWLTHAHFDHVGALAGVKEHYDVPVYLHPADVPFLRGAADIARSFGLYLRQPQVETQPLAHGQRLQLGAYEATCLYTPGHAPGHMAFYFPTEGFLLAGDALFRGSIGRYDLPGGDYGTLIQSIRRELLTLPDETVVYPGHGPETTIGQERRTNPFLQ